ncbi:MAG: DUF6788 family protein [Bryobacteraceae bacterium]
MSIDSELDLRGKLIRGLGASREMFPGSFVERRRKCGKPNCRCADGEQLHQEFLLSVVWEGQPKTFHLSAEIAEQVRAKVEMRKRFEESAAAIANLNLRRFLRRTKKK